MNLERLIGNFWSRQNKLLYTSRSREETIEEYKKTINYHTQVCIVCGKRIVRVEDGLFIGTNIHHICRFPEITAIIHKNCHHKLEKDRSGKYKNLKPKFTRFDVNMIQSVRSTLIGKQFKNFDGSKWVRFK